MPNPHRTARLSIKPFTTKDGSTIRELMHPDMHGNRAQSVAEATVPVGARTHLHRHHRSEEIYHILEGRGSMVLAGEQFDVEAGDTIAILPQVPHAIANTGAMPLRILCCCVPAYQHADTELLPP